jgi:hypothetical protein
MTFSDEDENLEKVLRVKMRKKICSNRPVSSLQYNTLQYKNTHLFTVHKRVLLNLPKLLILNAT